MTVDQEENWHEFWCCAFAVLTQLGFGVSGEMPDASMRLGGKHGLLWTRPFDHTAFFFLDWDFLVRFPDPELLLE